MFRREPQAFAEKSPLSDFLVLTQRWKLKSDWNVAKKIVERFSKVLRPLWKKFEDFRNQIKIGLEQEFENGSIVLQTFHIILLVKIKLIFM